MRPDISYSIDFNRKSPDNLIAKSTKDQDSFQPECIEAHHSGWQGLEDSWLITMQSWYRVEPRT